jgi:5,10-methylenetetrahydromethanopterin reductase
MRIDLCVNALACADELAQLAVLAEGYGIQTLWTASYLAARDPWSNLVPAARSTREIGLGAIAVNPYDTHPVRIATGLLTLNEHARGRARVVVGGGGEALQALALPPQRRVRTVGECIEIIQGVKPGTPFSYAGAVFTVNGYNPGWATAPKPPVYAAVNKPQMLRMAARHSNGIMLSDLPPALCRERIGWVREHLREFHRASAGFRCNNFLAWHVYPDGAAARAEARQWLGYRGLFRRWVLTQFMLDAEYDLIEANKAAIYGMVPAGTSTVPGVPLELLDRCVDALTLTGTPADCPRIVAQLEAMAAAGCTEVVLELHADQAAAIRLIGEVIVPAAARF